MKRKGNLYQNLYKFENIQSAFNEVCKNTKNKKKVARFKEYKCIYISRIYDILEASNNPLSVKSATFSLHIYKSKLVSSFFI